MTNVRAARIAIDFKRITKERPEVNVLTKDSFDKWTVSFMGPEKTPYEGANFNTYFSFPEDYPFSAPKIALKPNIRHCNISPDGKICLPVIGNDWLPTMSVVTAIDALIGLLRYPNYDDPFDTVVAFEYKENPVEYWYNVLMSIKKSGILSESYQITNITVGDTKVRIQTKKTDTNKLITERVRSAFPWLAGEVIVGSSEE